MMGSMGFQLAHGSTSFSQPDEGFSSVKKFLLRLRKFGEVICGDIFGMNRIKL